MGNASAEPQSGSFSDATCQRLTQLLLRCVSLPDNSVVPPWAIRELQQLLASDSNFADWCSSQLPAIAADVAASIHGDAMHCSNLRCGSIAYDLPRQLLRFRYWQNRENRENSANSAAPIEAGLQSASAELDAPVSSESILLDVANLAIRLRGFEHQFQQELELRYQQTLYNFAYGLSHELNNPLANIATRAGVLAQDEPSQQRLNLLHAIVDNAMRGCEMLGDLMLVARPPHIERKPIPILPFLKTLVEKGKKWVEPRGVTLEMEIRQLPEQPEVEFDPSAMTEALWVLIRNGVEAMPMGGRLTICTSYRLDLAKDTALASWWIIEIEDEGMGISPHALQNCFDPFFSGREAGRGLGVGLTKAQRLVGLHHGRLSLDNRTDRTGCRAVVELPIAKSTPRPS